MPQIWGGLERSIVSGVVEARELGRVVGLRVWDEIVSRSVLAMSESERAVIPGFDGNLSDAPQTRGQPFCQRDLLRRAAHFNAREIRKAACSRKSLSASVNAFNFSLSTSIKPTTFPDSVMTGTTISDCVLPNVGK